MKRLFAFGGFADYPQSILAAVQRLARVGGKLLPDMLLSHHAVFIARHKGLTAMFTYTSHGVARFYDPQVALWHEHSLAHGWEGR
jgi:hypothetical protein